VQNGSVTKICPQAAPAWYLISAEFSVALLSGNVSSFNYTAAAERAQIVIANAPPSAPDPRVSEDCLFLDVIVPKKVFDGSNSRIKGRASAGAPVMVW
jgi:hypothetical protein